MQKGVSLLEVMVTAFVVVIGLVVVMGIRHGVQIYFEVSLLIAMLGFVSTVALARFLLNFERLSPTCRKLATEAGIAGYHTCIIKTSAIVDGGSSQHVQRS